MSRRAVMLPDVGGAVVLVRLKDDNDDDAGGGGIDDPLLRLSSLWDRDIILPLRGRDRACRMHCLIPPSPTASKFHAPVITVDSVTAGALADRNTFEPRAPLRSQLTRLFVPSGGRGRSLILAGDGRRSVAMAFPLSSLGPVVLVTAKQAAGRVEVYLPFTCPPAMTLFDAEEEEEVRGEEIRASLFP